jgi:3-keto-5-aminohexanoate cleavage enzyme
MSEKVVISAALSGGATTKSQNPSVPYTPEEFAEEAYKAYNSGATVVHIHARDIEMDGLPTADMDKIRPTIEAIRDRCPDLLINMSSAISMGVSPEQRITPIVEMKPEIASLNSNSMNFALADRKRGTIAFEFIFENTFGMIVDFATKMKENKVKPEFEVYDLGGMYNIQLLRKQEGLFEEPMHFQFVFGVAGGIPFDIRHLNTLVDLLPKDASWSVCGVGPNQFPAGICAAALGGHIRVGLEDNFRNIDGSVSKGNYEQVEWAVNVCKVAGRGVASPEEARQLFHCRPK